VTSALLLGSGASQTAAPAVQSSIPQTSGQWVIPNREQINAGTVTIVTAPIGGTAPTMGANLASVLDDTDRLRVLPIISKGFVQNVLDVLYLKTVDMGIVVSDVPEFYKLQYNMPNIQNRLPYIAKLYNAEVHVIAPKSIKSVYDLAGKRVAAPKETGYFAAKAILSRLNIDANIVYDFADPLVGLQAVIDGRADAWFTSAGKPQGNTRNIKNADGRLHFVSIPYDRRLMDLYLPANFTSQDYPNLVDPNDPVDTVAASVILVTYNWPENTERYNRVAKFIDAFFSKINDFHKPPWDQKWKETSISAKVAGWPRFKAAQDWLDREGKAAQASKSNFTPDEFKQFMEQRAGQRSLSQEEVVKIYNEFVQWRREGR
jgi:TRAP transporter TAXI family solute receptor